jgi:hypothetical protein
VSFQTNENIFNATLPPSFSTCSIDFHSDLCFIFNEKQLAIYTKSGERLFLEEILQYSVEENTLNAYLPLSNGLGWLAKCTYSLTANCITKTAFSLQAPMEKDAEKIREELLAYAFFESVLLGLDPTPYLAEELHADKDKLQGFLGNFTHVLCTDTPDVCGLIYKKDENLFQITYFQTEIKQGKIINVRHFTAK